MSQFTITVLLVGGALGALSLLVAAVRRERAAGHLDAASVLTFGMGSLVILPVVVVVISGGLVRRVDVYRELVPVLPAWYQPAAQLSMAIAGGLAALLLVRQLVLEKRRVSVHAAALFAILLWAVAQLASALHGGRVISLSAIVLLAGLAAAAVLPRGRGAAVGVGMLGVVLAAGSGLFAAIRFDLGAVACRHECVLGSSITGVMPNENLLGTALVAALPFVYLGFSGRARTWLVLYVAAMAITTGSRGAVLAALAVVAALAIVRPGLDAERRPRPRAAVAAALLAGAVLASVYVVQHDWSTAGYSLTDRPAIWSVATRYIEESPVFGYGPERWETLYGETGEIPRAAQHSTHNQWLDVLFTAGWVGLALLVAMIVAVLRSAGRARPAILLILATALLIGVTERAWSVGWVDFASFSLLGLLLTGPPRGAGAPPELRLGHYLRAARVHAGLVAASVLACLGVAAALAWTQSPSYSASTQLFVSTSGLPHRQGQVYEGGLYAQQRMRSYAEVIASPAGALAVIEHMGLRESPGWVQDRIRVAVPPNSVLLRLTATAGSPSRAKAIADALGVQVPALIEALERPRGGGRSPVQVTVTSPARLPAGPTSPRRGAYLALGLLFGLALGVAGAVGRSALDDRVRDDADAGTTAGAPVLGRIVEQPDRGAQPVVLADPFSAAAEGLRGLRTNLGALAAEHNLRSFVVTSPGEGEGKTHVAANLALAMAQAGERVAVIDANLRAPRLSAALGVSSSLGLTNVLDLRLPVDVALRRHPDVPLEVLTSGPSPPNPSELLGSERFRELLDAVADAFDFVIVDAPAALAVADASVLARQTSGVVVVARDGVTGTVELRAALRSLRRVDARVLGVVLNRVRDPGRRGPRGDGPPRRRDRSDMVARL